MAIFLDLFSHVESQGLLTKQPLYYAVKILFTCALLLLGVVQVFLAQTPVPIIFIAAYWAFVFGQFAFLTHEAGHQQMFAGKRWNDWYGLINSNVILGFSHAWWVDKHMRHHQNPNHEDRDPDIHIPFLAFSEDQARQKSGIVRFMVKHQTLFFFPVLLVEAYVLWFDSLYFLFKRRPRGLTIELVLMAAHVALYTLLLATQLGVVNGLLFVLVHRSFFGLYVGMVFAPNHKGMLLLKNNEQLDFLHTQVLTARNVRAGALNDFFYGGLNYQIEHHLFPTAPRRSMRAIQQIAKAFCRKNAIPYHETGAINSYREILGYLRTVSNSLRAPVREAAYIPPRSSPRGAGVEGEEGSLRKAHPV